MNIGIIGAGKIGSALAVRLVALGHDVAIANSRGPATLGDVVADTGATAVEAHDAARGRELVVVTIEQYRVPELGRDAFAGVPDDVVVLETNNYYPQQRDGRIDAIEQGTVESRWVADQLGRPNLVKAFNNIHFKKLREAGRPAGDPDRFALPYAGDDTTAKATVGQLIESLGFDAIDAGSLDDSWRQQPGTPAYGTDLPAEELRAALADAPAARPAAFRATE
jgi:8-hydroxy-5-deazaflavin:NADPH oxidoreductase